MIIEHRMTVILNFQPVKSVSEINQSVKNCNFSLYKKNGLTIEIHWSVGLKVHYLLRFAPDTMGLIIHGFAFIAIYENYNIATLINRPAPSAGIASFI